MAIRGLSAVVLSSEYLLLYFTYGHGFLTPRSSPHLSAEPCWELKAPVVLPLGLMWLWGSCSFCWALRSLSVCFSGCLAENKTRKKDSKVESLMSSDTRDTPKPPGYVFQDPSYSSSFVNTEICTMLPKHLLVF